MIIEQIWTANLFRNFNYLVACPDTGEAVAIDPLAHKKCRQRAEDRGWRITRIVNTHHHIDHTGGNRRLAARTGATIAAHRNAIGAIRGVDQGLDGGDVIRVGTTVELAVLDTPGHTFSDLCLLTTGDKPTLFSGDTLFNAGVGNCRHGDPGVLYRTFSEQLALLHDDTRIYPGHDYLRKNLRFALSVEPDNEAVQQLLSRLPVKGHLEFISTLGQERRINPFLRLNQATIHHQLRAQHPTLPDNPEPETVFRLLRLARDRWSEPVRWKLNSSVN